MNPKIFREKKQNIENKNETKTIDETTLWNFLPPYVPEIRNIKKDLDRLAYMQHYGVPTRLLDWTDSILIALYFSVSQHPNENGNLFVLNPRLLNQATGFVPDKIY